MISMETLLVYIILMSSVVHTAISRPDGAPSEACNKLKPRHGRVEQEWKPGLINLTISGTNSPNDTMATYVPGKLYTVRLSSNREQVFCKGFLVIARYKATGEQLNVVGAGFQEPTGSKPTYKLSACYPPSAGVTHINSTEKKNVEFKWKAPSAKAGPIEFRFTCVQYYDFYYVNIEGLTITPDPNAPTDIPFSTHPPTSTLPPTSSGNHVQMSYLLMLLLAAVSSAILYTVH